MHSDSKKLIFLVVVLLMFICLFISLILFLVVKNENDKKDEVCDNCGNELDHKKNYEICSHCFAPINKKFNKDIYNVCLFFAGYLVIIAIILLCLAWSNWQFVF